MTSYCLDGAPVADVKDLCRRLGGTALRSPFRSTVPLINLVAHASPQWQALLKALGAQPEATVHFEYRVPSPKAGGSPSQTDALVTSDVAAWAIEAKWTEPSYETVAKRTGKPEADGADPRATIAGWLGYIQPFATRPLEVNEFAEVVYQMLHRTASACHVAMTRKLRPELVYLHFRPSPMKASATKQRYLDDLRRLHTLVGNPSGLTFSLAEMPLRPTAAFERIRDLDKRSPASAAKIAAALCAGPLFEFGPPDVTHIG